MATEKNLQFSSRIFPILGLGPVLLTAFFVATNPDFRSNATIHWLGEFFCGSLGLFCAILILRGNAKGPGNALKVLAIGILGASVLDVWHGLSTIPTAQAGSLNTMVPWGWLPSRILFSTAVCVGIWVEVRERQRRPTSETAPRVTTFIVTFFVLAASIFLSSYAERLPSAYSPLADVPRASELAPALLFSVALISQFFWGRWRSDIFQYCLLLSLVVSVLIHTVLMPFAASNFDNFFAAAVIGKVVSYIFILAGVILQSREMLRQETISERMRQRAIVETASDGIITFDVDGKIDTFNAAAEALYGYTAEEAIGGNITMLTTNALAIENNTFLQRVRDKLERPARPYAYEAIGKRKDGSTFPVESAINEVQLGETRLFTAIIRDITQRREEQATLEDVTERLSLALESSGLGSWEDNLETGVMTWDKKMFELYDFDPADGPPSLENWIKKIQPEDREYCLLAQKNAAENGTPIDMAFRILLPDDTIRWIQVDGKLVEREGDRPRRLVGVNRDVSESLRHLEEVETARTEADEANRAKSAFLATMSHEIRTPLNGVIGLTEVLQKSNLQKDQEDITGLIAQSAHSLMEIIEDILDLSKIEAGKLEIDKTNIDVASLAQGTCAVLTNFAEQSDVELSFFTDQNIPALVTGDGQRLRQILTNLINNAIKFSSEQPARGHVALRAEVVATRDQLVEINFSVIDNGIGMDSDAQNRLFAPFTQADSSTSRRFGGTGLGLTISQRLAQLMDGKISVQSELGKGSTFTLRLPFSTVTDTARAGNLKKQTSTIAKNGTLHPAEVPSRDEAIARKQLILIAEDNEVNRKVIVHQLGVLGYQADLADNGVEALKQWRTGDYSLLLTDLQMPLMDGFELAKNIRAQECSTTKIPIIALTANTLMEESEKCESVGMNGFLIKPASLEDLNATLEDYLERQAS